MNDRIDGVCIEPDRAAISDGICATLILAIRRFNLLLALPLRALAKR